MSISFLPVITYKNMSEVADLAKIVWNEYFIAILKQEQIDYMIEKFQSVSAIREQIKSENYQYFLLQLEGKSIGYMAVREETEKLFLSKIYIRKEYRGKGYANEAFEFLEGLCLGMNLKSIWLRVNRENLDTIGVYEHKGFANKGTDVADIGNGYVMDDYIMEKIVQ